MKVALVYDRVNKWGGAERLLLVLHELFPKAPLFTSVYNKESTPWAKVFPKVIPSFLQSFPLAHTRHDMYALLMPLAFESFSFAAYDLVISVTSEAAKGIITAPRTKHLCYCLTPTRYLWSGYNAYFANPIVRTFTAPFVSYLRAWDKVASKRPDAYVAISKEVQRRIKQYYGRESTVVYPPITIAGPVSLHPRPTSSLSASWRIPAGARRGPSTPVKQASSSVRSPALATRSGYFLIVSRLVPYKRIDIAIRAFNRLKLPLVIVGTGSQETLLRSIARPNITFVGNLTEEELLKYYRNCRALIFPGSEDFGLTLVEAQSFGKPVIAFKGGGALETIIDGKTGMFFSPQTAWALKDAVVDFAQMEFDPSNAEKQAYRFSQKQFKERFLRVMKKLVQSKSLQ